jgi:Tfp pilus assembly protein PilO
VLPSISELPITMTVAGSADHLSAFLNRLQAMQPRALLITTASLAGDGSTSGKMTLSLGMKAFVAPAASKTPAVTTTN